MHNIEATNVLLAVDDDTSTTHVTTTSDHDDVASIEFDKVEDLVLLKVEPDSVVGLDVRVGVPDGATIMGDDMGNTVGADGNLADLEQLVLGLLGGDAMDGEAALDIVEDAEVLARLLNADNVYTFRQTIFSFELQIGVPWKPVG